MKTALAVLAIALISTNAHAAKSCIPGPSNPGGCMGVPDLNNQDAKDDGAALGPTNGQVPQNFDFEKGYGADAKDVAN